MEHGAFDALARDAASSRGSRRGMLRLLAGGTVVSIAASAGLTADAGARRKRKKKSRQTARCTGEYPVTCPPTAEDPYDTCFPAGTVCCGSALGGGACYAGQACCAPSLAYPSGSCAQVDEHCCPADAGGGSCPLSNPTCCPPTEDEPAGFCSPSGVKCCNFGNIYCDADEDCCEPSYDYPDGLCVPRGVPCPMDGERSHDRALRHAQPSKAAPRAEHRRLAVRGQRSHH